MMARLRLIVWMAAAGGAAGASALELRSSRPENNVFVPGERIEFAVTGGEEAGRSLAVRVTDFWEQEVQAGERPLAGGSYTQAWTFDSPRLGYFLLSAEVRSGTASVARARMPFAVIPPPTAEMAAPEFRRSPFGLCGAGIGPRDLFCPSCGKTV